MSAHMKHPRCLREGDEELGKEDRREQHPSTHAGFALRNRETAEAGHREEKEQSSDIRDVVLEAQISSK